MNHEQLVIIQKKAAVFLLRHKNTEKHELIEKTAQYFEREISGETVTMAEWRELHESLAVDRDRAQARSRALAMTLDLARAMTLDLPALDLDLARDLARSRALDLALDRDLVDFLLAELGDFVPVFKNLDKRILEDIELNGFDLEMGSWHTCKTTHCRAGFCELYAGDAGKTLVKYFDHWLTGAMIYKKSAGYIPDFFARNEEAMESIREGAANWKPIK